LIGKKLAHYTITGKLGEGGMGVVYEARDAHLDRTVALKLLPHDALANPSRKQRFVQEAKAASALNHPHIVTIYDIASDGGTDYIAMELIQGRTLEAVLSRGKLRLADALKYGAQIADALAAAHAAGIVHRDLKPGNVMITERGDVKVLDFGLAKLSDVTETTPGDETRTQRAVTEEGSVMGSAPYMSPEQAQGLKVDARSDIFSFGSLLYEMITGRRAFQGSTRMATMAAVVNQEPEPPSKLVPGLPRDVERWVTRCLRKELGRRSQSMAEIRVALQDLKEETETGSLMAPVAAPARKRARWLEAVGALAAVIGIAAAALRFFAPGRDAPPLHAEVLTSYIGYHGDPSLSPDGNQFAFAWDGDVLDKFAHVYISLVGKGTPLRLTPEGENAYSPSWSSDGQSIAFWQGKTDSQKGGLFVIPALGGPGRKIVDGHGGRASWSPDGKWLLWSQYQPDDAHMWLYAAPAAGGEPHRLAELPPSGKQDFDPQVSPDGRKLVFVRMMADFDSDLYLADFQDGRLTGEPRQLTRDHDTKASPVWTGDGREIVYIGGELFSELAMYRIRASGGASRRLEGIGTNAARLTLAARSNRMLYSVQSINYDIRRVDLRAPNPKPERFLSSTRYESSPSYSPDGQRIAFTSNRGGVRKICVADSDGANVSPLTSFSSGVAASPRWSPDGQTIAFVARPQGNADIYTMPAQGGAVKRLTDYPGEDDNPTWSPDGKWIYFESTRAGGYEMFRVRPDGGAAQQITHDGGDYGMVAPDGKWLYYSLPGKGLWKMPADGGDPSQVLAPESLCSQLSFVVKPRGIYAVGGRTRDGFPVVFFPFDGGKPQTLMNIDRPPRMFPEVSPDGRWLLYSTADDPTYGIMLVENFR